MINQNNKRERLIDSAATLFHTKGLHATSLADIAKHADIPIGNVYYYFKAKEDLALAALEKRREPFRFVYARLEEAIEDPRQRLIEIVKSFDAARNEYTLHGCPVGKIIEDADVEKDNVAKAAADIFVDFVECAARQFRDLGHQDAARTYAITLLSGLEGAILSAKTFGDPAIVTIEIERLMGWLESLPNKKIQLGKVGIKTPTSTAA